MSFLHATVQHKTFGQGEIVQLNDDVVCVTFAKPYGKKKFLFPTAFSEYLSLEDKALKAEMAKELKQSKLLIAAEQQRAERSERIARYRANAAEKATAASKAKKKKK